MARNPRPRIPATWSLLAALAVLSGCASARMTGEHDGTSGDSSELEQARRQVQELRDQVTTLTGRLEGMELQVSSLKDELKAASAEKSARESLLDQTAGAQRPTEVRPSPTTNIGKRVEVEKAPSDPQSGYSTDAAVDAYRSASILFESGKYPESMLAFTAFLDRYADHAWAGSAQFFIGEGYFRQKEYRLALEELQRVLTSYDRSPHVADALQRLVACEEQLKMPSAALEHRQLLTSLFPGSPAAIEMSRNAETEDIPPTAPAEGAPSS